MNKFKSIQNPEIKDKVSQANETIKKAGDFDFFLKKESLPKIVGQVAMISFLLIGYIYLSHLHIKTLKHKDTLQKELIELRSEYISIKSILMKKSNQSELSSKLEAEGLKELRTPPKVIKTEKK